MSIVANSHCIKLIAHIPLKSADHTFTLYKIIILPERISSDKFVQYAIDYPYLAIQSVSTAIFLSQRENTANVLQVTSLYASWIQRYLIHKDLPVPLVYFSRTQTASSYVREIYSSTIYNQR